MIQIIEKKASTFLGKKNLELKMPKPQLLATIYAC